jgi:uncharacterized protein (UPF0332 family)
MTSAGRELTVAEELQAAEEELRAASTLLSVGLYRIALTRIYFATSATRRRALLIG